MVDAAVGKFGGLHVAFNNAGTFAMRTFADITEDLMSKLLDTNFKSLVYCFKYQAITFVGVRLCQRAVKESDVSVQYGLSGNGHVEGSVKVPRAYVFRLNQLHTLSEFPSKYHGTAMGVPLPRPCFLPYGVAMAVTEKPMTRAPERLVASSWCRNGTASPRLKGARSWADLALLPLR